MSDADAPRGRLPYRVPARLPSHPRGGNALTRAFGRLALRLSGWTFDGDLPDEHKLVIVVAPHTSNWDFPVGVMARASLGIGISYLGKHTLFRPPLGWVMRWLGGIPVHRTSSQDIVRQVAERFRAAERMFLALSPEGTRRKVEHWRTGFWHIAREAGVKILPVGLDFPSRSIRIGTPVTAGDDLDASLAALREWFTDVRGLYPELA